MAGCLEGKVALVTGGGSGIGRASALAFAREGAMVVIADVAAEDGEETRRLIEAAGGRASYIWADISRTVDVEALIGRVVEVYGRLDCAHNNAGILNPIVRTHEHSEDDWDRIIAVNLKGVWLCMKYELARMLTQGGGAIVNTAASLVGSVGLGAYIASKHGVVGLTKTAALEYARDGIRINAVCPGATRTPMAERWFASMVDQGIAQRAEIEALFAGRVPIGRLGMPEEVAEVVVWLCSDAASFVTGVAMPVDGGSVTYRGT